MILAHPGRHPGLQVLPQKGKKIMKNINYLRATQTCPKKCCDKNDFHLTQLSFGFWLVVFFCRKFKQIFHFKERQ